MTINALRLHNEAYEELYVGQTLDWAGATHIAAVLCLDAHAPSDLVSTYSDLTHECEDTDYSPKAVPNRTVVRSNDQIRYGSDRVDWGSNVTISGRYIYLIVGDPANLQAGDRIIGHVDLGETKSAVADTDNSSFAFTPATSGWWNVDRSTS